MFWSLQIRTLEPLAQWHCPQLCELYCCENKISSIKGISHLTRLSILELGSNRIPVCQLNTLAAVAQWFLSVAAVGWL